MNMQVRPLVTGFGCCTGQVVRKQERNGRNLEGTFDNEGDPEDLSTR